MPQAFRVVKCSQCNIYQVDIVKKAKKWQCKLCGEKQTVIIEYGIGTSRECRLHVQKLNAKKNNNYRIELEVLEGINEDHIISEGSTDPSSSYARNSLQVNKWHTLIDPFSDEEENQYEDKDNDRVELEVLDGINEDHIISEDSTDPSSSYVRNSLQANKWDTLIDPFSDGEENQYEDKDNDRVELEVLEGINEDHIISEDSTLPSSPYVQNTRQANKWDALIGTTSDEEENQYEDEGNDRVQLEVLEGINEDHIIGEDSTVQSSPYVQNFRQTNKWNALIDTTPDEENHFEEEDIINRTKFENLTVPHKKRIEKFKPLKRLVKVPEGKGSKNKMSTSNGLYNFVLTKNRNDATQEVLISPRISIDIIQGHEKSKSMWNTSKAEYQEASSDDYSYFDKIPEFV